MKHEPDGPTDRTRRRPTMGGMSGGSAAGVAMALAMAMRVLMPLYRNLGPIARPVLLLVIAVGGAATLGVRAWRRHREEREIAVTRAKRAERRAQRERTSARRESPPESGPGTHSPG